MSIALPHNIFAPGAGAVDITRPGAQMLLAQPWFPALPDDTKARVVDSLYTIAGGKGETLLHAGEEVKAWHGVLTGLVKLQTQTAGRRQGYLGIPAGEWFGEGSVLRDDPRRYDVVALRDSELVCLPRKLFAELYETSLPFVHAINRHMNMRLGQALAVIETLRLRTPEQRVAMYLGPLLWHGSRRLGLSQEELGILSGMSRQTVNSVLNDFERRKLVSLDFGRIEIRDEAGLMDIVFPRAAAS